MRKNKKNKKINKNKNISNKQTQLDTKNKNYTNALDLQFLSCYNHTKERNKHEEQIKKLNTKNLKHYQMRILKTAHTILNNSTNKITINYNNEKGEKIVGNGKNKNIKNENIKNEIIKNKENESIPLNIHNAFLHFSQLCIDHFEFSDVSKIVQKNITQFENEKLKQEQIKNEKIRQEQMKNNKRNTLKLDLNDTTENRIKNINNLIINKPVKKKKITDFLEVKTVKKCQTFPTQIRK